MPRKRKVADPSEFKVQSEKLWQWLVDHGAADGSADRRTEIQRIHFDSTTAAPPDKRRAAVTRALMHLDHGAVERATAAYYLQWRAGAIDKAVEALRLIAALRAGWKALAARAEEDRATVPPAADYWPSDAVDQLSARDAGLVAASLIVADFQTTVEKIGDRVWGADTSPDVLKTIDNIALMLGDGGLSAAEIADLLDESNDADRLKVDRWRKRVEWARKVTPRRSKHGAPISVATAAEHTQTATYAPRRSRPRPNRAGRRGPSRSR